MSKVIETDSRGRISLKKLGVGSHTHYQVSILASGNVLLEPVDFTTALQTTLDATLPTIRDTIAQNRQNDYPVSTTGKSTLSALLTESET